MEWLSSILRDNPVIPIFLTIGLGFWIGGLKYKSLTLGPVTVATAVAEIGYSNRPTDETDMVFVGLGVTIRCFIGALQDNLDSTLSTMSDTVTYAVGSISLIFAGIIIQLII